MCCARYMCELADEGSIYRVGCCCRVPTQYAEPSLVVAHRALLAAALQNPRNSMFLLLSESCTPLYHPAVIWAQLAAESHLSRVAQGFFDTMRWHGNMESPHLQGQQFRKSPQWSSLTRMHALLATRDEHVWPQFAQFCRTLVRCACCALRHAQLHQRRTASSCGRGEAHIGAHTLAHRHRTLAAPA